MGAGDGRAGARARAGRSPGLKLFTSGFARKGAERFFRLLADAGVWRLVDVRRDNTSQLAGFARRDDLAFFCRAVGVDYLLRLDLAPSREPLDRYRRDRDRDAHAQGFRALLEAGRVEEALPRTLAGGACLICSEDAPHRCHRRLIAEYLRARWGGVDVEHLR